MNNFLQPKIGDRVKVIEKNNYQTGKLTGGVVAEILTKKEFHPRGIKVRLSNGVVGRVQEFVDRSQPRFNPAKRGFRKEENKKRDNYFDDSEALI